MLYKQKRKRKNIFIRVFKVLKNKGIKGLINGISKKLKIKKESITPFYLKEYKTNNNNKKLPISVIIPTIKSRKRFLEEFVIPSVEANNPMEIIIMDQENLTVQQKRNKGFKQATQKYLFFCDDDTVLPKSHLYILYNALEKNLDYSFAYTDYQAIVIDKKSHTSEENYYWKAGEFDLERLKISNYIDTSSLVRRDIFCGWDENIKRCQDWDVWLTLSLKGLKGLYVKETGFLAFYLDCGITSVKTDLIKMRNIVKKKHNLD